MHASLSPILPGKKTNGEVGWNKAFLNLFNT